MARVRDMDAFYGLADSPPVPRFAAARVAPDRSQAAAKSGPGARVMTADEIKSLQRQNFVIALEQTGGRISGKGGAAELLGVKPSTLTHQLKVLGIKQAK